MSNQSLKYLDLIKPLGVNTEQAGLMIGSIHLFEKMISAKWIKPVINVHRLRLWDAGDVEGCWKRLKAGDQPEVI